MTEGSIHFKAIRCKIMYRIHKVCSVKQAMAIKIRNVEYT